MSGEKAADKFDEELEKSIKYRKEKDELGKEFQDFISDLFNVRFYSSTYYQLTKGETSTKWGIECKRNEKCGDINENNYIMGIWIEVAEKGKSYNPNYIISDWITNKNTHLLLCGNPQVFFIFSKKRLFEIIKQKKYKIKEIDRKTSLGFTLSFDECEKECLLKYNYGVIDNMVDEKEIIDIIKTSKEDYKLLSILEFKKNKE